MFFGDYDDDYDDDDIVSEGLAVRRQANHLRSRAMRHPHPADPDALSDEEEERLADLEEWSP